MRNQGKGSASTKNQCSRSRVPHLGPIPEGILATGPIPEGIPKVAQPPQHTVEEGISSHPTFIKEEEEKEEVVEAFNSKDEFEIFDQILSPKALSGDLRSPSLAQSSLH